MRISTLVLLLFLTTAQLMGQYMEVGVHLGLSNYMGELSENKMRPESFGSMFGAFGRYNFTNRLSAKASLIKGTISGSDEMAKDLAMRERNLSFRSDLIELAVTGEYNLSPFNIRAKQTGVPYVFTGIAVTHFNPQAQMRGSWYDLQPLKTEGSKYNRYAVAVPFGLGMKFNISYKVNFGFEFGARKTFTDYLDDVSTEYIDVVAARLTDPTMAALAYRTPELTGSFGENPVGKERGNADNKDWYFFGGLTISVNLTDKYGLDFDEKYEIFKEHLKKPKKEENKTSVNKQKENSNVKKKNNKFRLFKKKKYMSPYARKQLLNSRKNKPKN